MRKNPQELKSYIHILLYIFSPSIFQLLGLGELCQPSILPSCIFLYDFHNWPLTVCPGVSHVEIERARCFAGESCRCSAGDSKLGMQTCGHFGASGMSVPAWCCNQSRPSTINIPLQGVCFLMDRRDAIGIDIDFSFGSDVSEAFILHRNQSLDCHNAINFLGSSFVLAHGSSWRR